MNPNSEALDNLEFLLRDLAVLKSDAHYWALTLWLAYCYAVSEFDFSPRLGIWSPEKRCGKSLLLEIISHIVPKSRLTSSISVAALYRTIEKDESTVMLIDESDTVFGRSADREKSEALRAVLNAGFKRGQVVTRCDGNNFEPRDFNIFCPVALAGIGTCAIPETVSDRSIMIEMRRKMHTESIREFESDEIEAIFSPVRDGLSMWVEEHRNEFRPSRPEIPGDLNSRARDLWKPLFKVAESAGEGWFQKATSAAVTLSMKDSEPDDISLQLRLLIEIKEVFVGERMPSSELLMALKNLEESPWAFLNGFNSSMLAKMLKNYGIRSQNFRSHRGYSKSSFLDAWMRYAPPLEGVTPVTPVTDICDAGDECDAFLPPVNSPINFEPA